MAATAQPDPACCCVRSYIGPVRRTCTESRHHDHQRQEDGSYRAVPLGPKTPKEVARV